MTEARWIQRIAPGNRMLITAPPAGLLRAVARPPWAAQIAWTMASPRPTPPSSRLRPLSGRRNRSKACGRNAPGKPGRTSRSYAARTRSRFPRTPSEACPARLVLGSSTIQFGVKASKLTPRCSGRRCQGNLAGCWQWVKRSSAMSWGPGTSSACDVRGTSSVNAGTIPRRQSLPATAGQASAAALRQEPLGACQADSSDADSDHGDLPLEQTAHRTVPSLVLLISVDRSPRRDAPGDGARLRAAVSRECAVVYSEAAAGNAVAHAAGQVLPSSLPVTPFCPGALASGVATTPGDTGSFFAFLPGIRSLARRVSPGLRGGSVEDLVDVDVLGLADREGHSAGEAVGRDRASGVGVCDHLRDAVGLD